MIHDVALAILIGGFIGWHLPERVISTKKSLDNPSKKG